MGKVLEFVVSADFVNSEGKKVHRNDPILGENLYSAAPAWIELNYEDLRGATNLKTIARTREDYEKKKNNI